MISGADHTDFYTVRLTKRLRLGWKKFWENGGTNAFIQWFGCRTGQVASTRKGITTSARAVTYKEHRKLLNAVAFEALVGSDTVS